MWPRVEHERDVGGAVLERAEVRLRAQHLTRQAGAVGGPDQRADEGERHQHRERGGLRGRQRAAQRQPASSSRTTPNPRQC